MTEWIETDDAERLAAAVQAGVRVECRTSRRGGWFVSLCGDADDFSDEIEAGTIYRIPARVVWPPEALVVPEGMTPERLREIAQFEEYDEWTELVGQLRRWADDLAAQIEGGGADDREATGAERYLPEKLSDPEYRATYEAARIDFEPDPDEPPVKVRLTVYLDAFADGTHEVHEITEGGFWRYVTDERDRPERLIVRPGPAPSERWEYPLAKVVGVHMDPIGAKR